MSSQSPQDADALPISESRHRSRRYDDDRRRDRSRERNRDDDGNDRHNGRMREEHRDSERRRRRRSRSRDRERNRDRSRSRESKRQRRRSSSRDRRDDKHRKRSRSLSRDRKHEKRRRSRSTSPNNHDRNRQKHHSRRSRSKSPPHKSQLRRRTPSPHRRAKGPLPSQEDSFRKTDTTEGNDPEIIKQKPNFNQSGLLAAEANLVAGTDIILKYHEPADSRQPPASQDWRLFIFKGEDVTETIPLGTRSCWLLGREKRVVDIRIDHPSASKQHAVIQFRYVERRNEFGDRKSSVRPYLIDLESANGTDLNGVRIASGRFVEVRSGDMVKIGMSEREYVFMLAPKESSTQT